MKAKKEERQRKTFVWGVFEILCLCMTINTILRPQHPATHTNTHRSAFLRRGKERETRPDYTHITSHKHYSFPFDYSIKENFLLLKKDM